MSSSSSSTATHSVLFNDNEQFYHYQPSPGFAIVALVVFGILMSVLAFQTVYYRKGGWFTSFLAVGAALEFIGYVLRYVCTTSSFTKDEFIISYVLILVTPNFFAFVNYSAVGRLLRTLPTKPRSPTYLRIPIITDRTGIFIPSRIAKFFLISDIIAFCIQASAAAFLTSSNPDTVKTGQTVVEIGLAWAMAFIALFFFVTIYVFLSPTYKIQSHPQYELIQRMYISLFVTITLLLARSIYRLVEYVDGQTSYVQDHEWVFGVFDFACMALACCFYSLYPYAKYLQQIHLPASTEYAGQDVKEIDGVAMERVRVSPGSPVQAKLNVVVQRE